MPTPRKPTAGFWIVVAVTLLTLYVGSFIFYMSCEISQIPPPLEWALDFVYAPLWWIVEQMFEFGIIEFGPPLPG